MDLHTGEQQVVPQADLAAVVKGLLGASWRFVGEG